VVSFDEQLVSVAVGGSKAPKPPEGSPQSGWLLLRRVGTARSRGEVSRRRAKVRGREGHVCLEQTLLAHGTSSF